jgi:hypothetical protein
MSNQHRKTHSLANGLFINPQNSLVYETKEFINELKLRHHPLDDSIVESTGNSVADNVINSNGVDAQNGVAAASSTNGAPAACSSSLNLGLSLTKEQQKQILNSVKLNDPPSLLKELLKHRHTSLHEKPQHARKTSHNHVSLKHKFSCYSSNTADLDDDDDEEDLEAQIDKLELTTPTRAALNEQDVNNNFSSNSTPVSLKLSSSMSKKQSSTAKSLDNQIETNNLG